MLFKLYAKFLLIATFINSIAYSQLGDYKQTIDSAAYLFNNKQYREARELYKSAQAIKPNEKLPRYRIEDINTILGENVPIAKPTEKEIKPNKKFSFFGKKEAKETEITEAKPIETKAITQNTNIINEPKQSLVKEDIETKPEIIVQKADNEKTIIESQVQASEVVETKAEIIKQEANIEVEKTTIKESVPILAEEKRPDVKPQTEKPKPEVKKTIVTKPTEKKNDINTSVSLEVESVLQDKAAEEERLKTVYKERKTVQIFKEPSKTTTRIIMNNEGNIIFYTKIEHNWGGVFYFMQYPTLVPVSITQQFFNQSTND